MSAAASEGSPPKLLCVSKGQRIIGRLDGRRNRRAPLTTHRDRGSRMAKSTLQQQMGRDDPDLTPEHDKIMLWLEQTIKKNLISGWFGNGGTKPKITRSNYLTQCQSLEEIEAIIGPCPLIGEAKITRLEWEAPLWCYNMDAPQLFLDMVVVVEQTRPEIDYKKGDVIWHERQKEYLIGFEVKPRHFSIGKVLRQLKTYRRYFKGIIVLVAPPSVVWEPVIRSEGFHYLNIPLEVLQLGYEEC